MNTIPSSQPRYKTWKRFGQRGLVCWLIVVVMACWSATTATAQQAKTKKNKLPSPVEVGGNELTTRDGVLLRATFYPSNKGKEAVPIILLHMGKGRRNEYDSLAPALHKQGHAVLVPDLRGHGDSTTQRIAPNRSRKLDATKLRPADFANMVRYDMETLKTFLMKKHNAGELNIEKLCVVGAEMGASIGLDWARLDWSWPPLVGKKQGQDVKAVVLISPQFNFSGLDLRGALNHPAVRSRLSVLIIVGKGQSRSLADAQRIEGMFARSRPKPSDPTKRTLYFAQLDTKLQGTKMLGVPELNMEQGILGFIDRRLTKQASPWKKRE